MWTLSRGKVALAYCHKREGKPWWTGRIPQKVLSSEPGTVAESSGSKMNDGEFLVDSGPGSSLLSHDDFGPKPCCQFEEAE